MKKHIHTLNVEYVNIHDIKENEYNPKKFSEQALSGIKDSITRFGFADPLILNGAPNRKNILIGGHGRLKVAKELGFETVPAVFVNLPDVQKEKELNIRLHKNQGEFDFDLLKEFDQSFLKDVGFSDDDLGEIFFDLAIEDDGFSVEKELENIGTPTSKLGDLYALGSHRLLCGDSTNLEDVQRVVGAAKIDMIYNDPVYNIGLSYKTGIGGSKNYGGSANDKKTVDEYETFLRKTMKNALAVSNPDTHIFYYCDETYVPMIAGLYAKLGINFKRICIWLKGVANPTPQVAFSKVYEPCVYGTVGKPYLSKQHTDFDEVLNKEIGTGHQMIEQVMDMFDVWAVRRLNGQDYQHPTQKPLTLHEKPYHRCTEIGDNILSLFGGSGGDLLAAHQLKRNCFMVEMDPVFVDLIIRRFERYTGIKAVKVA